METLETADSAKSGTGVTGSIRRSPTRALAIALSVVLVAALIVSVIEWQHYADRANRLSALQNTQASALKSASTYAVWVGSYDYTNLHGPTASWTQIENHSTPDFKAKYQQTTSLLESTVTSYKGSATATVQSAAVSSVKGSTATVLIELAQKNQTFLVTITEVEQHGRWLISAVAATV
jgi:type II secretory pathway pseudopilin PulG